MDYEKPFKCPKCSQAFATSDKLVVHQRLHVSSQHQLLVKIPATSSDATEQTPTPTRFLKTADVDSSLLFEEINPFDQDFKLASKRHASEQSTSAVSSTVELKTRRDTIQQRCGSSSTMRVPCNGETEVTSSTVDANSKLASASEEARLQRLLKPSCAVVPAQNQITSSTCEDQSENAASAGSMQGSQALSSTIKPITANQVTSSTLNQASTSMLNQASSSTLQQQIPSIILNQVTQSSLNQRLPSITLNHATSTTLNQRTPLIALNRATSTLNQATSSSVSQPTCSVNQRTSNINQATSTTFNQATPLLQLPSCSTSVQVRASSTLPSSSSTLPSSSSTLPSCSEDGECSLATKASESNASIVYRTQSSISSNSALNTVVASSSATTKQTVVSTNQPKQTTETSLQSLLQQIRKQTQSGDETVKSPPTSSATPSQEVLREQLKSLIKSGQIKIKFTSDPSSPKVQATIVGNIAKKSTANPRLEVTPTLIPKAQATTEHVVSVQQTIPDSPAAAENQQSLPKTEVAPKVQVVVPNVVKQPLKSHVIHIKPRQIIPKPVPIAPKEVITTTTAATTTSTSSAQSSKSVTITPMSVLSVPACSSNSWQVHTHPSSSLAFAKQKLKHVIQQNATTNGTENSLANGRVSMVTTTGSSQGKYKDIFLDSDLNDVTDCESYEGGVGGAGKRKGRLSEECSPEEKRQRFLERNRAAASRCRQKRKIWVNQLESKSDDLIQTNNLLMNEINALRSEVAQLKALLLAHKECPVTLQQKALLGQMTPGSYVAAVSDGQIIAIHQVPNGNAQQTSSAEEVASSALTDMAARATIELGNHVSSGSVTVQSNDGSVSTIGSTLVSS